MHEDLLLEGIRREEFYKKIEILNLDLKQVFKDKSSYNSNMKQLFNVALMKLKDEFEFDIVESILFIEEDWTSLHCITSMLDGDTIIELKKELSIRNNIKLQGLTKFKEWF